LTNKEVELLREVDRILTLALSQHTPLQSEPKPKSGLLVLRKFVTHEFTQGDVTNALGAGRT
jgi:hypothetical protein